MKPEEFCEGVKILLARMESNPEDFDVEKRDYRRDPLNPSMHTPKFYWFHEMMVRLLRGDDVKSYLDWAALHKAEKAALVNGFKNMMRKKFSEGVVKSLLEEKKPELDLAELMGTYAQKVSQPGKKLMLNPVQVELLKRMSTETERQTLLKEWSKP